MQFKSSVYLFLCMLVNYETARLILAFIFVSVCIELGGICDEGKLHVKFDLHPSNITVFWASMCSVSIKQHRTLLKDVTIGTSFI